MRPISTPAMLVTAFAAAVPVLAGGAEADIDDLDAKLVPEAQTWRLLVKYDVEIEDCRPGEVFDLVFHISENGRILPDAQGRPFQIVIPLTAPTEIDDDELTFKSRFHLPIGYQSFREPDELRLHARVMVRGGHRPLDRESTGIDCDD